MQKIDEEIQWGRMMCAPKAAITSRPKPLASVVTKIQPVLDQNLQLPSDTLLHYLLCRMGTDQRIRSAFPRSVRLTARQTAFLVAVPVLLGALLRVATGMLAHRFGGRAFLHC